ncbi:hypothetical protein BGW38_002072 [Lunasporangiospora selenospora]|uniref:Uncharacterized protein n=1 Tax=Lunasporangiospora selenospora TaxID=979761 RepID=A0A9P6FSW2_9FUNG|nr:hypothetical protein BGW38_002072 [Lunasporangiospora selenospora]
MYEAVGRPRMMDAGGIPRFYERSDGINVEGLDQFTDIDEFRFTGGEGPAMGDFLKRCHGLKSLELVAGDPYMFRWAIPSPAAHRIPGILSFQPVHQHLERLERLKLWSDFGQPILLHALNEAVLAFGKTLREICCQLSGNSLSETPTSLDHVGMFPELKRLPKAMTLGVDWYLPNVLRIDLELDRYAKLGSFDECPLLEELTLSQFSQSQDYLSSSQEQSYLEEDQMLLPVWRLSRLTKLSFSGELMVRFNFESLRSMKRLRDLNISASFYGSDTDFVNIYSKLYPLHLQHAYSTMKERIQARSRTVNTGNHTQDDFKLSEFLPWNWGSDSLTNLSISGAPVMAFNLEQLKQLPKLCDLSLYTWSDEKYNISTSNIEAMARIHSWPIQGGYPILTLDHMLQERRGQFTLLSDRLISNQIMEPCLSMYTSDKNDQDIAHSRGYPIQPFVLSRLQGFSIDIHWRYLTPETLVYLLTWLAPNLSRLRMDLRSEFGLEENTKLFRLLKAIQAADQIVASRNMPKVATVDPIIFEAKVDSRGDNSQGELIGESPQDQSDGSNNNSSEPTSHPVENSGPGIQLSLAKVKVNVVLEQHYLKQLGFREIERSVAKICQKQGTRLYELQGRSFVEESDLGTR